MTKPTKASCKVLPFAAPIASREGQLEKWFRGVIQSNYELITSLERLRDSYQLQVHKPMSAVDQATLSAVEITLNRARNAQVL